MDIKEDCNLVDCVSSKPEKNIFINDFEIGPLVDSINSSFNIISKISI